MAGDPPDGPPRALMIAAVAIAVTALATVLTIAATRDTPAAPVVIAAVPAPGAQTPECQALINALPDRLGDLPRAATAEPTPAGTLEVGAQHGAVWGPIFCLSDEI